MVSQTLSGFYFVTFFMMRLSEHKKHVLLCEFQLWVEHMCQSNRAFYQPSVNLLSHGPNRLKIFFMGQKEIINQWHAFRDDPLIVEPDLKPKNRMNQVLTCFGQHLTKFCVNSSYESLAVIKNYEAMF